MKRVGSLTKRVSDFRRWAEGLILDTGDPWELEPFQVEVVRDVLAGFEEVWMVVPEGNGKTTLVAGIALHHADTTESPEVPVGASSREQAEILYRQAYGFVARSPRLGEVFRCYDGYRRITLWDRPGRIQVYAADDRTGDGVIPTLALIDELHRHRDLRLYRTWRGKLEKRGGQIMTISTAGEPGSEFEDTRDLILKSAARVRRRGAHVRAESEGIVLHDWAVRDRSRCGDLRAVAAANPRRDMTVEMLRRKRASPTMTEAHWQRFVCNVAARESGQAITPAQWDRLAEPGVVADGWTLGWLDLGWQIDTTAMGVVIWEGFDRRVIAGVRVLEPPVDEADIVAGLLDLQDEFGPFGFVYDPNAGGRQMAQLLEAGDHPLQLERDAPQLAFFEHSQDNSVMSLAAARFDEAIRAGRLVHDGDLRLRAHALNAVRHDLPGERWRYDRPSDAKGRRRQKYPIDALTGAVMGHSVAVAENSSVDVGVVYA